MPLVVLLAGLGLSTPAAAQTAAPRAQPTAQAVDPTAEAYDQFLLAQRFEEDEDIPGAIAAYKRAMALDPKAADIVATLADLYMRQNRALEAIPTAEQALKIDPANADAHRVLGTIYATLASQAEGDTRTNRDAVQGNVAKAIDHLEQSIAHPLGEPDANTRAMLSRLYISAGSYDKAIAMLTDLIKQEPGWQDGATLLVQAYAAAGRSAEAVSWLEQAAPEDPRLYPILADFYGRQDRWQEAAQTYEQALQLAPRNFDLTVGYASALLNVGGLGNATKARDVLRDAVSTRGTDQRALFLLSQAERLAGDFEASEGTARRLIALNRASPRAYVALSEALEDEQRYQAVVDALAPAVTEFRSTAGAAPALGALLPHLGFAYQQIGKFDNAITAFEEAQKLAPTDPAIASYLIQAQLAAKNYSAAAQTAHAARANHPDDLRLARLEAQALRQGGKADQGIAVMQDVVTRHADDPAAYIALAQVYSDSNRGPQAVKTLQDAQTKFPTDTLITFELGAVFDKEKKYSDAEAAFRQLISKEPENAAALNYLGYMLAERGDRLDESVGLLQHALQIEPDNGSYLDSLGWAYFKEGKLDLAADNLKKASGQLMTNSVIQDHYGDVLFKMGRFDDAIAAWTRALGGDGDSIDRTDIDKKIKSAKQKLPKR